MFGLIGLIIKGITGLVILSIIMYPFNLNQVEYQENEIRVYSEAEGFMSACCNYKIVESRFLIFEKLLARIQNQGQINFKESKVNRTPNLTEIIYQIEELSTKINKTYV